MIEETKDLSSLALDELIGNLKVHELVMGKDFEIYKGKKEKVKSIALRAKKEYSDDETSTSKSDDEEYVVVTLRESRGESFWEEGDDFGVDVLCFHTCLIHILGFLEKFKWWFEQNIDDEGEEDKEEDAKDGLAKQGNDSLKM
nr:UBN2 domain-containing protein [Tanacetum cinerariifolium]